jgi:hypothetical protein
MTTSSFNANGNILGDTITANTGFTGNGSQLTNLPIAQITASAPNAVVITDGSSKLTTENQLSTVRGGIGVNSSASTGIPHVSGGTWTFSGIASADLAPGFFVTNAQTTATSNNTPSTIVSRDGSGNFAAGNVTTTVLTQNATQVTPNGIFTKRTANVQTTNTTVTPILTITTSNSSVFMGRVNIAAINTSDASGNTGVIEFIFKATTNSSGVLSISALAAYISILDTNVSGISSTVTSSGNNTIVINVVGVAKNINWIANVRTLSQT